MSADHKSGNTSLDTLLALLQAEGAKIEEETEVSVVSAPCWKVLLHLPQGHAHLSAPGLLLLLSFTVVADCFIPPLSLPGHQ